MNKLDSATVWNLHGIIKAFFESLANCKIQFQWELVYDIDFALLCKVDIVKSYKPYFSNCYF